MGWLIDIKETKKGTKYRLWSTNVDSWISKWSTREEMLKFLFWHRFEQFMEDFTKDAMTFPDGYTEKSTEKRIMTKKTEEFYDFAVAKFKVKDKSALEVGAEKFRELITNAGIEVTVKDSDGYSF